ncbi:MAG TPA: tetratricopeptide repeat protein, partial [Candidatus Obscuribacterales bacterium]
MKKLNSACREFIARAQKKYEIDFSEDALVLEQLSRLFEKIKSEPGNGAGNWGQGMSAFLASWLVRLGGGTTRETELGVVVKTAVSESNVSDWVAKSLRHGSVELLQDKVAVHLLAATGAEEAPPAPADHEQAARLLALAHIFHDLGRLLHAEQYYVKALSVIEASSDADPLQLAPALAGLAECRHSLGKFAEASPLYAQAVETLEKAGAPAYPDRMDLLMAYAQCCYDNGDFAEAA